MEETERERQRLHMLERKSKKKVREILGKKDPFLTVFQKLFCRAVLALALVERGVLGGRNCLRRRSSWQKGRSSCRSSRPSCSGRRRG